MLDIEFLRLCWIASVVFAGDIYAAAQVAQRFDGATNLGVKNLECILSYGFAPTERTHTWLIGTRRTTVEQYLNEVATTGKVHADIRNGWRRSVLIRRDLL